MRLKRARERFPSGNIFKKYIMRLNKGPDKNTAEHLGLDGTFARDSIQPHGRRYMYSLFSPRASAVRKCAHSWRKMKR
jgi:hypothetical protein